MLQVVNLIPSSTVRLVLCYRPDQVDPWRFLLKLRNIGGRNTAGFSSGVHESFITPWRLHCFYRKKPKLVSTVCFGQSLQVYYFISNDEKSWPLRIPVLLCCLSLGCKNKSKKHQTREELISPLCWGGDWWPGQFAGFGQCKQLFSTLFVMCCCCFDSEMGPGTRELLQPRPPTPDPFPFHFLSPSPVICQEHIIYYTF